MRLGWHPDQVARLDPDFADKLMLRWKAESDHAEFESKQMELKRMRRLGNDG